MTMAMVMAMVVAIAMAMAMAMTITIVINQSMCRLPKLTSPFQVIITIAWLIGVTSNIPTFIHLKVTNGLCYETWPDDWKIRTYNIFLTTQVCVALSVMVTLYSRVVFALWFKRNGTNAVTPQQKVSADKLVCKKVIRVLPLPIVCSHIRIFTFRTGYLVYSGYMLLVIY